MTSRVILASLALAGTAPAYACPPGAPSCTTAYDVAELTTAIRLDDPDVVCKDLLGAAEHFESAAAEVPGEIQGRVFHPVDGEKTLDGPWPLVVFAPGNGLDYRNYPDTLAHIAGQGAVVISVEMPPNASVAKRSDLLICGARYLRHSWSQSKIDERVMFAGHSRGGEAAVMAANRAKELELAGSTWEAGIDVRGVAAIAPSAQCDVEPLACIPDADYDAEYNLSHADLSSVASSALFVIQGSSDGDVDGQGLRLYEDASHDDLDVEAEAMTKAMVWTYGAFHKSWGGGSGLGGPQKEELLLARAYLGAFAAWRLNGESHNRRYLSGEAVPPCVEDPAACGLAPTPFEIFQQFREGSEDDGDRLVVHNFQAPATLSPSQLGPVQEIPLGSATVVDLLTSNPGFDGHVSTRAAEVTLAEERRAELRFQLPVNLEQPLSRFAFLSLRLGKPTETLPGVDLADCVNVDPKDLVVEVELKDAAGGSHTKPTSDVARIAATDTRWNAIVGCEAEDFLTTVRLPLIEYWQAGVDPDTVVAITLSFPIASTSGYSERVTVDSVEFTYSGLDPFCGDQFREGVEECDTFVAQSCASYDPKYIGGDLTCSEVCTIDTSSCIEEVCGNGIVEGDEACDDGNTDPWDDCNPDCTLCPPGEPFCGCVESPGLPKDGMLGLGLHCNDDVLFGGQDRCVEMVNGAHACVSCEDGSGPFCPCNIEDSCGSEFNPGVDSDILSPNVPIGATMTCEFAFTDPDAPGPMTPALGTGFCFAEDEASVELGGAPEWFYDWYCEAWYDTAEHEYSLDYGHICVLP